MKRLFDPVASSVLTGVLALGLSAWLPTAALASRLPSGRVVFDRPPELIQALALAAGAASPPQLQFAIALPANAGEPLEALVIRPRDPNACVVFDPQATIAYTGKLAANTVPVPLASIGGIALDANEILVVFATPIEPGQQVTVVLTNKTPQLSGTYEYGVTAYPAGDSPVGQFLGYDLLHF